MSWWLALPTFVHEICCDQPSAPMNANLVCNKNAISCVVGAQTIDGPGTCSRVGCDLVGGGSILDDGDTLLLTCVAPGS